MVYKYVLVGRSFPLQWKTAVTLLAMLVAIERGRLAGTCSRCQPNRANALG